MLAVAVWLACEQALCLGEKIARKVQWPVHRLRFGVHAILGNFRKVFVVIFKILHVGKKTTS